MVKHLKKEIQRVNEWSGPRVSGRVTHVIGLLIESIGPEVYIGELCYIYGKRDEPITCQVVGFKDQKVLLMPLGELGHIAPGAEVFPTLTIIVPAIACVEFRRGFDSRHHHDRLFGSPSEQCCRRQLPLRCREVLAPR